MYFGVIHTTRDGGRWEQMLENADLGTLPEGVDLMSTCTSTDTARACACGGCRAARSSMASSISSSATRGRFTIAARIPADVGNGTTVRLPVPDTGSRRADVC